MLEQEPVLGGIARTEEVQGFLFDLGGHRFHTDLPEIETLWTDIMQDDFLLRPRLSRIYYRRRFFDYPLKLLSTLRKLGFGTSAAIMASYLYARVRPYRDPQSFEQWVVNRFGRRLYEAFFRSYTEKVWGMPCSEISADWAAERIRGLSLREIVQAALAGNRAGHASLIDQFRYPPRGPSMMWERMASLITESGGEIRLSSPVETVEHDGTRVTALRFGGERLELEGAAVVSSAPLRELVLHLEPEPPAEVLAAARALRFRGLLTVAVILEAADLFPDNWVYVHEPQVRMGRIQSPRNWSPAMAPDSDRTLLGLEYFCWPGEDLWTWPDEDLIALGARELTDMGLRHGEAVHGGRVVRVPFAYPVYDPGYQQRRETLLAYLAGLSNLQVIGRGGTHRYDNMDLAMLSGLTAARQLYSQAEALH